MTSMMSMCSCHTVGGGGGGGGGGGVWGDSKVELCVENL